MDEITVDVNERKDLGKNASRRMRREGRIPAILYGGGRDPLPVTVDPRRIEEVFHGERGVNTMFRLRLPDREVQQKVMVREHQRHPVTDKLVHADFVRVELDRKLQVKVPVRLEGEPEGVKNEGGVVDFVNREILIECLPSRIPESLSVDISGLHIGQNVSVNDLVFPGDVEPVDPKETVLATVVASRKAIAEEEEEAAAAAAAEEAAAEEAAAEEGKPSSKEEAAEEKEEKEKEKEKEEKGKKEKGKKEKGKKEKKE